MGLFWTLFQVWPLTQLYFAGFLQSRIGVQKCIFNKSTIKVCVSYSWRCPSDLGPYRAPHMMGFLFPWSSGSNAPDMSREIEVCHSSSKSPSRVWDGYMGVAGRIRREKYKSISIRRDHCLDPFTSLAPQYLIFKATLASIAKNQVTYFH